MTEQDLDGNAFEEFDSREVFGDFLKRHREASGKTLEQIARSTRIPSRYLQAFEDSDQTRFPEETFTRGFLRAYAIEVGLEVEEVLAKYDRFKRSLMPTQIRDIRKLTPGPQLDPVQSHWKSWAFGATALVALGGVLYLAFDQWSSYRARNADIQITEEVAEPSPGEAAPAVQPDPAASPIQSGQTQQLQTPVAPSVLRIKALKKGSLSLRLDEHPLQDMNLQAEDIKVLNVFKEVEIKTADRAAFEFQYNGRPLEVSGPYIKLFNRNLFKQP